MSAASTPSAAAAPLDLGGWQQNHLAQVEQALSQWVGHGAPAGLGEAMRYAVLDGGKRLRPLLVVAAVGAVDLIPAYSLVHAELPWMDNDVLRRGNPPAHVRFGPAQALLAGDALQAFAFELLTPEEMPLPAATQAALCRLLARAAGSTGMAGGQAIDLASVGLRLTEGQLRQMHRLKTGALLQASVLM